MSNTKKATTTVYFTVNFFDNTISGTKTSYNKAGRGIAPYYQQLTALMKEHPTFELIIKEPKKKSSKPKRTYNGMDFKFMEDYIAIQQNSDVLLREYQSVKAYAVELGKNTYPLAKKWFLGEFDPDGNGFDMAKAKKEIIQFGFEDAILYAHEDSQIDDDANFIENDNVA